MKYRLSKNTAAEQAYVRDMERRSAFEKLDSGQGRLLPLSEYPAPLRRFLTREQRVLRVSLSASKKSKLEQVSRASGIPVSELARRWLEQRLAREAG